MKILIVEDDEDIRTLIHYHLSASGFEIEEAADGQEAVSKLSPALSLVVLDLLLPRLSGIDVLRIIRNDYPEIPVIVTSALTEENDTLKITHETIGKHLGSPREVVTRMLKYFQNEGIVKLSRGMIEITDKHKLESLADE